MKVLVMGGTQFNGLALVHELVRAGHDVTILNRGRTDAVLPRAVRRLVGDRTDHDRMREVFRDEEFDCIQDMSAYHPEDVQLMIDLFRGRTGHYIFASSTVMYAPSGVLPIGEDHPVDRGPRQNEYGLHKILCEEVLVREHRTTGFPATSVPFSMVFGPRNIMPDREQRMFACLRRPRDRHVAHALADDRLVFQPRTAAGNMAGQQVEHAQAGRNQQDRQDAARAAEHQCAQGEAQRAHG